MTHNNRTKKFRGGLNESIPLDSPTKESAPGLNPIGNEGSINMTSNEIPNTNITEGINPEQNIMAPEDIQQVQEGPVENIQPDSPQGVEADSPIPPYSEPPVETSQIDESKDTLLIDETNEIDNFREKMADPENQKDYLFLNENISTEPNKNKAYIRIGVIHFTDSVSINDSFGNGGFDNIVYDKLKNKVLTKIGIILGENRRCYNMTVQIEQIDDRMFAHVNGTLYEKK
jgi:hypothetical protein